MPTEWDAGTYDRPSAPQQSWAADVLGRLEGIAADATVLDVGCGTGRVTEALLDLVPRGRVLAFDASQEMVELARARLGERAEVWRQDVLELELAEPVDAVVSNAVLHWVPDHDRMWQRLAGAVRPGGRLEIQCGGKGNIAAVREVIDAVAPDLAGWSPWVFAGPEETEARLRAAGFGGGCARPASRTFAAGCRTGRRTRRTSTRSCAPRSSPRTWRGCPPSGGRRS